MKLKEIPRHELSPMLGPSGRAYSVTVHDGYIGVIQTNEPAPGCRDVFEIHLSFSHETAVGKKYTRKATDAECQAIRNFLLSPSYTQTAEAHHGNIRHFWYMAD